MIEWANCQPMLRRSLHDNSGKLVFSAFANPKPEIVKWLLTNHPESKQEICSTTHRLYDLVRQSDFRLELFQWLEANVANLRYDASVMDVAAETGDLGMIQYLHAHRTEGCTTKAMDFAASNGHLHMVRFLHDNRTEGCTTDAMDFAARGGHLEVVRFLNDYRREGCTVLAVNMAGSLDMVRFLLKHRTEGCTDHAMDHAPAHGKIEVVRFLHENRTEGCTTMAMDGAAEGGHLEIVRFLHENRTEGCSEYAVDESAKNGHLDVVQFLCTECSPMGSRKWPLGVVRFLHSHGGLPLDDPSAVRAVRAAVRGGYVEVVRFLVSKLAHWVGLPQDLIRVACERGHLPVVAFLHERYHETHCHPVSMIAAAAQGEFEVVKYLNEHCDASGGGYALTAAARYGCLRLVEYLVTHRADGCLVDARQAARKMGHPLVEEYLTKLIDGSSKACTSETGSMCKDKARRLCQKANVAKAVR